VKKSRAKRNIWAHNQEGGGGVSSSVSTKTSSRRERSLKLGKAFFHIDIEGKHGGKGGGGFPHQKGKVGKASEKKVTAPSLGGGVCDDKISTS